MSTGGEVANALVCKTSIRGFNSRSVLQLAKRPVDINSNALGDSVRGILACEEIATHLGLHALEFANVGRALCSGCCSAGRG